MQQYGKFLILVLFAAATSHARVWDYHLLAESVPLRVSLDLRPYWDGAVDVNEVMINLNGTVQIHDLSLADRCGRNWLTIKYAELNFVKDADGFRFSQLKIKQPRVIVWFDQGDVLFPLNVNAFEESKEQPPAFMHFEQIDVEDAAVTVASDETYTTLTGFDASAQRLGKTWNYIFGLTCRKFQNRVDVNGFADIQNNLANFNVRANHALIPQQAAVILSIFGQRPFVDNATAQITANLRFEGRFDKEDILWPVGKIRIQNGTLTSTKGVLMSNFKMLMNFLPQRIVLFRNIAADSFSGKFNGSAYLESEPNNTDFGGHFVSRAVNLADVAEVAGPSRYLSKGTAEIAYDFFGTLENLEDYRGHGVIFLDDANLWKLPLVSGLFRYLEFGMKAPLTYSDAVAAFKVNGPVITIQRANITSRLTAVELLSGSTINYQTQYVDAHAVFVPLKKLRSIFLKIPVLRLFVDVYDQLAGISIRGYLWQPTRQLVKKEPIKDIKKITKSFFVSAANSGGQISRSTFTDMEHFFGFGDSEFTEADQQE
jgi:hypothetical protein